MTTVSPSTGSAAAPPAGRRLWADIGRAYLAYVLGFVVGVVLFAELDAGGQFIGVWTLYVGPLLFLLPFLAFGTRSKTLFLGRLAGSVAGWLGAWTFGEAVFSRIHELAALTPDLFVFVAAAFVAVGMMVTNFLWIRVQTAPPRFG